MSLPIDLLVETFEQLWPSSLADDWDAPGFVVSHPVEVERVLLSVDLSAAVLSEAKHKGANLVLTHHPFLLKGTRDANWDSTKGSVLQQAVRDQISVFAAHTNADIVKNGVSDTLARLLGLSDSRPLVQTAEGIGHGRIGVLQPPLTLQGLAEVLLEVLPFTARGVSVAGYQETEVATVALCAGAGDSFIDATFEAGADVYITSDLRHHPVTDAVSRPRAENHLALIDISHWAAESLWLKVAAEQLGKLHPAVEFMVSEVVTDPWTFTINKGEQ